MLNNPNLTVEEIRNLLLKDKKKFAFLIDCDEKYPNFISEVKNQLGLFINKIACDRRIDKVLAVKLP